MVTSLCILNQLVLSVRGHFLFSFVGVFVIDIIVVSALWAKPVVFDGESLKLAIDTNVSKNLKRDVGAGQCTYQAREVHPESPCPPSCRRQVFL